MDQEQLIQMYLSWAWFLIKKDLVAFTELQYIWYAHTLTSILHFPITFPFLQSKHQSARGTRH